MTKPRRRNLVLWWDSATNMGMAVCEGMALHNLPRKPRVMALDVDSLDYSHGVRNKHWVREVGGPWIGRDLTADEMAYIDAALDAAVKRGIDEIC